MSCDLQGGAAAGGCSGCVCLPERAAGACACARPPCTHALTRACTVLVLPPRRLHDTVRLAQALKSAICQRSALPFELKVLEALLSETARAFENKSKRLGIVADTGMWG